METMNQEQNNMQELESLRQEVRTFKERMDQQQIVNDRLLRHSMKSQVSWIKHTNGWTSVIGILFLPLAIIGFRYGIGMQWAPIAVLCIAMVLEAIFNFRQIRSISASMFATCDLLTVKRQMLTFKRREQLQMFIEVPMIILWGVWAFVTADSTSCTNGLNPVVGAVGFCIGLMIAFIIYLFEMRTLNKTLRELDDFTDNQK